MPRRNRSDVNLNDGKLIGIYRGVVENNNDPEKLGRCQIRIFGLHSDQINQNTTEGIPTEHLYWAEPACPIIGGGVGGFGLSSIPLQGAHVFVFFENNNQTQPRYFAYAPGQPTESPDTSVGFNDPDGVYPQEVRLNEPDLHRTSRGISNETHIEYRNDNIEEDVERGDDTTWSEPQAEEPGEYPNDVVWATHAGNSIRFGNEEGKESITISHAASNSYIEIDHEGNMILRAGKDLFLTVEGDINVLGTDGVHTTAEDKMTNHSGSEMDIHAEGYSRMKMGRGQYIECGTGRTVVVNQAQGYTINGRRRKDVMGTERLSTIGMVMNRVMGVSMEDWMGYRITNSFGGIIETEAGLAFKNAAMQFIN